MNKNVENSNETETPKLGISDVMHSCYDCKYYQYEYNDGTLQPSDPFCEKTHYDWLKTFPFKKTKCKQFTKRNCAQRVYKTSSRL